MSPCYMSSPQASGNLLYLQVNGITALVCIAVFYAILTYIRLKRLL